MNIILQKYQKELKNFLFDEISLYIIDLTMDFINNLFVSDNKYINLINSLTKKVRGIIKLIIIKTIDFFNEKFINDDYRRAQV